MSVQVLRESPAAPLSAIGPYREADHQAAPEEPRLELLFGRFFVSPSPSPLHQVIVGLLGKRLLDIAIASGGWSAMAPLDVFLADHSVVQPDVVYLAADRRKCLRERVEGAPTLVVEVLSTATARRDRGEKLKLYAQSGVQEYWLVDGESRQIEFLVNRGKEFAVALAEDGVYRSAHVPELILNLEALWGEVSQIQRA